MSEEKTLEFLKPEWRNLLKEEFSKPYMNNLREFLKNEVREKRYFYPPKDKIFRCFSLVDYSEVRVVILGQDPYHGFKQANGMAFAVEDDVSLPPSLMNIFKEIERDFSLGKPRQGSLESWARQGVFLLNTVLTVQPSLAFSHRGKGWEIFTDKVISLLNERKEPIVFLLWGSAAQAKEQLITQKHHLILKSPHPSPLSAHRGFIGNGHFSKANEFLQNHYNSSIEWHK